MSISIKELQEWDKKIYALVEKFGLNCYPQEFEICDHHQMIGYMAYSGMPSRYSHWSFGKAYEKQKTLYDYGVAGLPYE
ncbi:MAG: stage V sporulation protein R, partial [Candidatus Dadabacteria bacterium]